MGKLVDVFDNARQMAAFYLTNDSKTIADFHKYAKTSIETEQIDASKRFVKPCWNCEIARGTILGKEMKEKESGQLVVHLNFARNS